MVRHIATAAGWFTTRWLRLPHLHTTQLRVGAYVPRLLGCAFTCSRLRTPRLLHDCTIHNCIRFYTHTRLVPRSHLRLHTLGYTHTYAVAVRCYHTFVPLGLQFPLPLAYNTFTFYWFPGLTYWFFAHTLHTRSHRTVTSPYRFGLVYSCSAGYHDLAVYLTYDYWLVVDTRLGCYTLTIARTIPLPHITVYTRYTTLPPRSI